MTTQAYFLPQSLDAASAYFVELLTSELKHESALQPLFDSRAWESLPAIEAKLDQLTNALKQAMTVASNYQQTVVNHYEQTITNRSGGGDFQAQVVANQFRTHNCTEADHVSHTPSNRSWLALGRRSSVSARHCRSAFVVVPAG